MTNNIRVFLWLGLALAVWLNYSQWQMDYGPKPGTQSTATSAPGESKPPSLDDTVPQAAQPAAPAADAPPTAAVPGATAAAPSVPTAEAAGAGKVRVTTDVLVLDIDLQGGTLVYAELLAIRWSRARRSRWCCSTRPMPRLTTCCRPASPAPSPTRHGPRMSPVSRARRIATSSRRARTNCACRSPGPMATASPSPRPSCSSAAVRHRLSSTRSTTSRPRHGPLRPTRASRASDPAVERSMFKVESFAFRGPAIYDPDRQEISASSNIEKSEHQNLTVAVKDGWLAGIAASLRQRHRAGSGRSTYSFTLRARRTAVPARRARAGRGRRARRHRRRSRKHCSSARSCRSSW